MDFLRRAYADASDGEEDDIGAHSVRPTKRIRSLGHSSNRMSSALATNLGPQRAGAPMEAITVSGRYVSKRERAMLLASSASSDPAPSSPAEGKFSALDVPGDVKELLKSQWKACSSGIANGILPVSLNGHSKAVNSIKWSPSHTHLLASAGMDQSVLVWNVWSKDQKKSCVFSQHKAAVKDVQWCHHGLFLLSCGYDCSSRLTDVEKGVETRVFKEDQVLESIRFNPTNPNLFLSGGSKGVVRMWDTRVVKVVHEYHRHLGAVFDVEFSIDGKHFISSTDTSRSNISENAIIVWDVSRQIPLSNQVYTEAFTCPCIRYHPSDACFVAQSNGNYIAIFSARPPFRMDRYKRYENHGVWGFPVKCNFSLDGKEIASGSSDGSVYFYGCSSSELLRKINAFDEPCIDVAYHPLFPKLVASCSWSGEISILSFS